MKKALKLLVFLVSILLSVLLVNNFIFAESNIKDSIDITLEQQESLTSDKIRYISTIKLNDKTLEDIESIDVLVSISKTNHDTKNASVKLTNVYDAITGTNGKEKTEGTYYAVYTITDLNKFPMWTLDVTFKYNYQDGTNENTNTVSHEILMPSSFTHIESNMPSCNHDGNYEYYFDEANSKYYDKNGDVTTLLDLTIPKTNKHNFVEGTLVKPTRLIDGSITYTCIECEHSKTISIEALGQDRVYFTNNQNWEKVNAYLFNSDRDHIEWPGIQMSFLKNNDYNQGIFYIDGITDYKYIIFNNGSEQTVDITIDKTTTNAYFLSDKNTLDKYTVGTWSYFDIPTSDTEIHHFDEGVITKKPTCEEIGYKTYTCTDEGCNETKTEIINPLGHDYDDGIITKEPTESKVGEITYTCKVCGATKTEEIPVLAHTHVEGEATYTWDDNHLYCTAKINCNICGKELYSESVMTTYTDTKNPTCTQEGERVYTTNSFANSKFEAQTITVSLPKCDHIKEITKEITKNPTCEESGICTYTVSCKECHEVFETKELILDPLGHKWDNKPVIIEPTRTTNGSATYTCTECENTKTFTIEALGQDKVYFTNNYNWANVYAYIYNSDLDRKSDWPGDEMKYTGNNSNGEGVYVISYDITKYKYIIFSNGKVNGSQTVDILLDRTNTNAYYISGDENGKLTVGTWKKYNIPSAVCENHEWNMQITIEATNTSSGLKTYTCKNCGEVRTEIIPMLGHTHIASEEYSYSSSYHYHVCTNPNCNLNFDIEEHEFVLIKENDTYYNVCSICGYIEEVEIKGLVLHYYRPDNNYQNLNSYWIWGDNLDANLYTMTEYDSYGMYYTIPYSSFGLNDSFGLIIKGEGKDDWTYQDGANKYFTLNDLSKDSSNYYHAYFVGGNQGVYKSIADTKSARISYFCIEKQEDSYILKYGLSSEAISFTITKNNNELVSSATVDTDTNTKDFGNTYLYYNLGQTFPNMNDIYTLNITFKDGKGISKASMWDLYDLTQFESIYGYNGKLGALYSKEETTFKVWSPVAYSMKLRIYETGTPSSLGGSDTYKEYTMTGGTKATHGVWTYTLSGNQSGKYYTYVVSNYAYENKEVVDPYAKSTGVNGLRGMVVDFDSCNPDGWDDIQTLNINPQNLVVYEAHIADLTSSSTWGGPKEYSKTYKGFALEGTTYTDGITVTTGFDHIKELGVNAVQLLPIFDSSNNEINRSFNWGYNPLNYNSLDGSYSTNPYDGYEKIKEFKELVYKYNQAGINIIMDVVFNHVSDAAGSNFNYLVPGYYFRYTKDGYLYNGSGCGNETASERLMYHKFMIDSTEFWAKEYKLGGFRFDLMGIHDVKTMQELAENLHTNVGENLVVYGEPWAASSEDYVPHTLCNLYNYGIWGNFGSFNSTIRDSMFGNVGQKGTYGWASTTYSDSNNLYRIMNGSMGYMQDDRANPVQYTVAYISCHDNYNVADHLATCNITGDTQVKASTLGHSIVLTSQGISFIQEGEEFLRTKDLNENSYNASYEVNDLDYSNKITYNKMFNNFKKLISLKTSGEITIPLDEISNKRNTIAYDSVNFSYFKYEIGDYVIIHHNGYDSKTSIGDYIGYEVYLDTLGYMSGTITTAFDINPYQTVILKKKD